MKKKVLYPMTAALIYLLLLILLMVSERAQPGANITSFWDAVWYSFVTLTTVGYGDLYPVSAAGRVIGFIFVLLSAGILASLLYAVVSAARGRWIPAVRLRLLQSDTCYLFSEENDAAACLAADLLREDPGCRILFFECNPAGQQRAALPAGRVSRFPQKVTQVRRFLSSGRGGKTVFLISPKEPQNYRDAKELESFLQHPGKVYIRGEENPALSGAVFFSDQACCARMYWHSYPLQPGEKSVVLIGDGALARALLDQAILANCRIPFEAATYHLFGNWDSYRSLHPQLAAVFGIWTDAAGSSHDALVFHAEDWKDAHPLLEKTEGRIIFCAEHPSENADGAALLARYYAVRAAVYAAGGIPCANATLFGDPEEVFTKDLVLGSALDERAKRLHEAYRFRAQDTEAAMQTWETLPAFLKASNRAAADHMLTKIRLLLPENPKAGDGAEDLALAAQRWAAVTDREPFRLNEHERWMRFLCLYNWRYGSVRDDKTRTHPYLTGYYDLPEEVRRRDDSAWEQIGSI